MAKSLFLLGTLATSMETVEKRCIDLGLYSSQVHQPPGEKEDVDGIAIQSLFLLGTLATQENLRISTVMNGSLYSSQVHQPLYTSWEGMSPKESLYSSQVHQPQKQSRLSINCGQVSIPLRYISHFQRARSEGIQVHLVSIPLRYISHYGWFI